MFNENQENKFVSNYRAVNHCTKVQAMIEYRNMNKTNSPFKGPLKNENIEGFDEWSNRGY